MEQFESVQTEQCPSAPEEAGYEAHGLCCAPYVIKGECVMNKLDKLLNKVNADCKLYYKKNKSTWFMCPEDCGGKCSGCTWIVGEESAEGGDRCAGS